MCVGGGGGLYMHHHCLDVQTTITKTIEPWPAIKFKGVEVSALPILPQM